ncbi:MAG: hypothetical protein ABJA37_06700 [Ferruginibacter sp.]
MKKVTSILAGASLLLLLVVNGCKKEETAVAPPLPGNEFLTTVKLVCTNAGDPADIKTVSVKAIDGQPVDYSNATLNLKKNSTYNVGVFFLDDTKTPAGDVTPDIKARQNYHLICFVVTGANLTVTRTDLDTNTPALPIGLTDKFTTVGVSTGSLNVQLRHQPNAKNGDCAPGSTDADVDFPINIIN